jgi:hypothetical protein
VELLLQLHWRVFEELDDTVLGYRQTTYPEVGQDVAALHILAAQLHLAEGLVLILYCTHRTTSTAVSLCRIGDLRGPRQERETGCGGPHGCRVVHWNLCTPTHGVPESQTALHVRAAWRISA